MIIFFSILFTLLSINVLLIVFSLRNTARSSKTHARNNSTTIATKLHPQQHQEVIYKKAV